MSENYSNRESAPNSSPSVPYLKRKRISFGQYWAETHFLNESGMFKWQINLDRPVQSKPNTEHLPPFRRPSVLVVHYGTGRLFKSVLRGGFKF